MAIGTECIRTGNPSQTPIAALETTSLRTNQPPSHARPSPLNSVFLYGYRGFLLPERVSMGMVPDDIPRVPLQQRLLGCRLPQKPQFLFADPATLDKRD